MAKDVSTKKKVRCIFIHFLASINGNFSFCSYLQYDFLSPECGPIANTSVVTAVGSKHGMPENIKPCLVSILPLTVKPIVMEWWYSLTKVPVGCR